MAKPVVDKNAAFRISQGKGFQMTFANGITVSVQFGLTNYCANRDTGAAYARIVKQMQDRAGSTSCKNAEFLAWDADGKDIGVADGWLTPDQVFAKMAELVALPKKV
jgi:hypothetical protein